MLKYAIGKSIKILSVMNDFEIYQIMLITMSKHIFLYCVHICSILLLILLWPDLQMRSAGLSLSQTERLGPGRGVAASVTAPSLAGPGRAATALVLCYSARTVTA